MYMFVMASVFCVGVVLSQGSGKPHVATCRQSTKQLHPEQKSNQPPTSSKDITIIILPPKGKLSVLLLLTAILHLSPNSQIWNVPVIIFSVLVLFPTM